MEPIHSTKQLAEVCARFANFDYVTVDTEFVRRKTYWPILSLVQLASPEEAVAVDALAHGMDLAPIFELMKNENVLKIFHAGRQDIEIFVHLANIVPNPVFDTQIAGMVCGFGNSISYENLVSKITGNSIDKSYQFTDWSIRPLTDRQLDYALSDVTHLRDVYQYLNAELEKSGRTHWIHEEMDILTKRDTYVTLPQDAWKRLKLRGKKPVDFALLQEIAAWREIKASEENLARKFVMEDSLIYEVIAKKPGSVDALSQIRGFQRKLLDTNEATELIEIVNRVCNLPENELPELPRRRTNLQATDTMVDLLKILLNTICEKYRVVPKIIASAEDLEKIVNGQDSEVVALTGWRKEVFGELALKLRNGEISIGIRNGRITLKDSKNEPIEL